MAIYYCKFLALIEEWQDVAEHFIAIWGLAEEDVDQKSLEWTLYSHFFGVRKQCGNLVENSETQILRCACSVLPYTWKCPQWWGPRSYLQVG